MSEVLRFFPEAIEEIEDGKHWYERRSEWARGAFLQEIDDSLDAILQGPRRWPVHQAGTRRYVCQTFPYSIIYYVEEAIVVVVAVAHERRRAGYWRDRLQ
jgi:toxin ParE1/3/4